MSWEIIKQNWLTPTGFLLLFGAVTWGIQLNVGIMKLTEAVAEGKAKDEQLVSELNSISHNNLKLAIIVEGLKEDVDENTERLEEHEKGSEEWKRKILKNELRYGQ